MSWGITIPEVNIFRVSVDNLESERDDLENMISLCKERLLILAASTQDISSEENMEYVHNIFTENVDSLIEYSSKLHLIYIAIEEKENLKTF